MFDIGPTHFQVLSIIVFAAGVATILTKRNVIGILIGVELILNAAGINLVAFNRWPPTAAAQTLDGQMFTIFMIVVAAAEAAIALAIFLNFYNNYSTIDVEQASDLKG